MDKIIKQVKFMFCLQPKIFVTFFSPSCLASVSDFFLAPQAFLKTTCPPHLLNECGPILQKLCVLPV